jgi:hypothetical protein
VHASVRFRQQLVDDRVEAFDACPRHTDRVRHLLERRHADHPDGVLNTRESTPPPDAPCPYDGPACAADSCDRHDALILTLVEDGQLSGTG